MASVAISLAVAVATRFAIAALSPGPPDEEGPRLDSLDTPKSRFGASIPRMYGNRCRGEGLNVFWSLPLEEEKKKKKIGGKGGGANSIRYEYDGTWACFICDNEIESIRKIWLDKKLVYNVEGGDLDTEEASDNFQKRLHLYRGTLDQAPSDIILQHEDKAPGFTGTAYVVFEQVPLEEFGNRIPQVDIEVDAGDATVASVLRDICQLGGLAEDEYEIGVGGQIQGFVSRNDGASLRDDIEQLQKAFNFYTTEANGKIYFLDEQRLTQYGIAPNSMGVRQNHGEPIDPYEEIRGADKELPTHVEVQYNNAQNDLLQGIQRDSKDFLHRNDLNLRLNLSLNDNQALTIAGQILLKAWTQRRRFENLTLTPQYAWLKPGDVIRIPIRNTVQSIQLTEVSVGANFVVKAKAIAYEGAINDLVLVSPTIDTYTPDTVVSNPNPASNPATVEILDINLWGKNEIDEGVYAGITGGGDWELGAIYASDDNGTYEQMVIVDRRIQKGVVTDANCPYRDPAYTDFGSYIDVQVDRSTVDQATETDFLNQRSLLCIYDTDPAQGEFIAYRDVEVLGNDTYRISHFMRGVRGTEHNVQEWLAGSNVIFLDEERIERAIASDDYRNRLLYFKAVHNRQAIADVTNVTTQTIVGNSLKPYSPVHGVLSRNTTTNTLTLNWERRTRKKGGLRDYVDVPLCEDTESYHLEILHHSTGEVLKLVVLSTSQYTYTEADQIADFGAIQTSLRFRVYQMSAEVGRGYPYETTLTPSYVI